MYSILISDGNGKWKFLTNQDGTNYIATTLETVQFKLKEILQETALNSVLVVKNCTITEDIVVKENSSEPTEVTEPSEPNV